MLIKPVFCSLWVYIHEFEWVRLPLLFTRWVSPSLHPGFSLGNGDALPLFLRQSEINSPHRHKKIVLFPNTFWGNFPSTFTPSARSFTAISMFLNRLNGCLRYLCFLTATFPAPLVSLFLRGWIVVCCGCGEWDWRRVLVLYLSFSLFYTHKIKLNKQKISSVT